MNIKPLKVKDMIHLSRTEFEDTKAFIHDLCYKSGNLLGKHPPEWNTLKNIAYMNFGKSAALDNELTNEDDWEAIRRIFTVDLGNLLSGKFMLMYKMHILNWDVDRMSWWEFNELATYVGRMLGGDQINS